MTAKNGHRYIAETAHESAGALIGWRAISRYCSICVSSLVRYRQSHGFPACKLPDGRYITSKTLIDQWIVARMATEIEQEHAQEPITSNQELTLDS